MVRAPSAPSGTKTLPLLPVAGVAFAALGVRESSIGVAWPSVRETFGQPLAALGIVLVAGTAGYLTASLASGRLAIAFGHRRLLVAGALVGMVGLVGVALSPVWPVFVAGMVVLGLSGGVLDAGLNTVVAVILGARGLSWAHAAFGAGAVLGPLVMALVVAGPGSWRLGYGLLVVAFAAVALCLRRADLPEGAVTAAHGDEPPLPAPPRHRSGLVCAVVLFFVYVGVELTAAQWSYSLFTEVEGMGEVAAGLWVGAFWAGFTAIRIVSGLAGPRWHGVLLLDLSLATAALGAGLLWWTPVPFVGGVGLVIVGVGTGLVFPTLVSLTPRRVGGERTPQAIGYQVGAAAVGAAAIPALFGVAAEEYGLEILGPVLVVGIAVLIVLHRLAVILER